MTVTVQMMRSAAAMDVDISVCLHIKVFVILMLGSPTIFLYTVFNGKVTEFGP